MSEEKTNSFEAMREELESADWQIIVSSGNHYFIQVIAPNGYDRIYGADFETSEDECYRLAIEEPYAMLQEKKRLSELEALAEEIAEHSDGKDKLEELRGYRALEYIKIWKKEAKRILSE